MPNPSSHAHLNASSSSGLPPATTPAASTSTSTSAPRARAQGARKRAAAADDAAYHAPLAGTKRTAGDRGDGDRERERVKRKRVADASALPPTNGNAAEKEEKTSLVDFSTLPTDALHRYLACFNLIPEVVPSPLTAEDPGPPSSLLKSREDTAPHGHALRRTSTASPGPGGIGTGASRGRRDGGANRRRSSRLVEDERQGGAPAVYSDLGEVEVVLATLAERHFRENEVKEVDTLTAFMCAVKAKSIVKIGGF